MSSVRHILNVYPAIKHYGYIKYPIVDRIVDRVNSGIIQMHIPEPAVVPVGMTIGGEISDSDPAPCFMPVLDLNAKINKNTDKTEMIENHLRSHSFHSVRRGNGPNGS